MARLSGAVANGKVDLICSRVEITAHSPGIVVDGTELGVEAKQKFPMGSDDSRWWWKGRISFSGTPRTAANQAGDLSFHVEFSDGTTTKLLDCNAFLGES